MIVSLAELKVFLEISDTTKDNVLTVILAQAQAKLESLCGRVFEAAAYTPAANPEICKISGDGDRLIHITHGPVNSIAGITIRDFYGDTDDTLDNDQYQITGKLKNFIMHESCWPRGDNNIWIEFNGGYEAADMPKDLELALMQIAAIIFSSKDNPNIQSESVGKTSFSYFGAGLPEDTIETINKYRIF